ncbi:MAG: DUF1501 domain-containing protein [Bdellovibrionales bacterium]
MKRPKRFENMTPLQRREFLKGFSLLMSAPFIPDGLRFACNEILLGKAHAQSAADPGTIFIEINLRDQYDFGHVFVAPGLATHANLIRGADAQQVALFDSPSALLAGGNRFYMTTEGRHLQPHLDHIAVIETCELSMGIIHGHEAANATRSPGRSYTAGAGRSPMWLNDPHDKKDGNEEHYSSTPTPAVLHNYYTKSLVPGVRNGVAYKGISRSIHTVYHFAASLANAQVDRYQSTDSLVRSFSGIDQTPASVLNTHADLISELVGAVDKNFLDIVRVNKVGKADHTSQITGVNGLLKTTPVIFNLALSEAERNYWSSGVPLQGHDGPKAHIWEQFAYAAKLATSGLVRTIALEFDHVDLHGNRLESSMRAQGAQIAIPLARLIDALKTAQIFDRTVIAIYTTDGGRTPSSDSYGNEGKNSVMLAGGKIQGGYYGDIRIAGNAGNGHSYSYHKPEDSTGAAVSTGSTGNDLRVTGASIWKTVAKAAGVPSGVYDSFPDVASAPTLNYLLR